MAISETIETRPDLDKHPKGLYVLFATEMWERFSFYTMVFMFTLYLRDETGQGFGWAAADATTLYANYLMFVYGSPLIGGWLADRRMGYRRAVMIGGLFFMAGHLLLSIRSMPAVYAALACLVIGNGLFKPNVSTMVGNLYPEGSHLKDRAYNIFYMGINVGAFLAPLVATFVQGRWGFHPAFAVAAFGMLISITILWRFKKYVEDTNRAKPAEQTPINYTKVLIVAAIIGIVVYLLWFAPSIITRLTILILLGSLAAAFLVLIAALSLKVTRERTVTSLCKWLKLDRGELVRIGALIVIFLIVIVFWMVFHQNGSTLTYWADENTDWNVRGIIAGAINPGWVIALTFPLVFFWKWMDQKGREPSTPTKMALGMVLTSAAFFILFIAAKIGEASVTGGDIYKFKMSPAWLLGAYGVLTAGELMLSPMGLSLVSKVAPIRMRGLMMGGWFVATAIGNKLTQIGVFWTEWKHSTFWLVLSALAMVMAVVLLVLLRPLKKAMPGV